PPTTEATLISLWTDSIPRGVSTKPLAIRGSLRPLSEPAMTELKVLPSTEWDGSWLADSPPSVELSTLRLHDTTRTGRWTRPLGSGAKSRRHLGPTRTSSMLWRSTGRDESLSVALVPILGSQKTLPSRDTPTRALWTRPL